MVRGSGRRSNEPEADRVHLGDVAHRLGEKIRLFGSFDQVEPRKRSFACVALLLLSGEKGPGRGARLEGP